jgi:3-methyladenine DNA glycosylase AlkD
MTTASPPIEELQAALAAHADEDKRAWWARYLKGTAEFRGVPAADIRRLAFAWWERHEGDALLPAQQLDACLELLRCPLTEDRLAGMLLLGERLIPAGRVDCPRALPRFAALYREGHLADWNAVDWFCVRVLGRLIGSGGQDCARAVAGWVTADVLWQRRSALVAFVNLAGRGIHAELIVATADRLVADPERFAQTAVAWVMRELAAARPDLTEPFLERHAASMSPEARKQARSRRPRREGAAARPSARAGRPRRTPPR